MRRGAVALVLAGLAFVASAPPASAHADVTSTAPRSGAVLARPPAQVVVTFSEPVSLDSTRMLDSAGATIPSESRIQGAVLTITPSTPLTRGVVTAVWHITADDGHEESGAIPFIIGRRPATGPVQQIALTPKVPATLSGSRPGLLTLQLTTTASSGEVEWTSAQLPEPIVWKVARENGRAVARGVLPFAGTWSLASTLVRPDGSALIAKGTATLTSPVGTQ